MPGPLDPGIYFFDPAYQRADLLSQIHGRRKPVKSSMDKGGVRDNELDGLVRTDFHTSATSPAGVVNSCPPFSKLDGIHKTDILRTRSTADTALIDPYINTRHTRQFVADIWCDMGQQSPETAAGAAVANRK